MNTNYFKTVFALLFFVTASERLSAQNDTIAPVITIAWQDTICVGINSVWVDQVDVTDNQSDKNSIILKVIWGFNGPLNTTIRGAFPVIYEATDSNGNKSTLRVIYRVDDCISPEIDLNTIDTVCHQIHTPYISVQPTVTDNYYSSGQISLVKKFSNVNPYISGLYMEVYEAMDGSGNITTKTRYVEVKDCQLVSVNSNTKSVFLVYPNPTSEFVHISGIPNGSLIFVLTQDGRLVKSSVSEGGESLIDISGLAKGVYVIQLNTGSGLLFAKLHII